MEGLNLSVSEENNLLRQSLIRIKYLSPKTNISVAQDIVSQALDKCAYRDPKTGEGYTNGREEELHRQEG